MGNGELKRYRAMKGADASTSSPLRYAPLRKIVGQKMERIGTSIFERHVEVLECGHTLAPRHDMIGETNAVSRRCRECLSASCAAAGHPIDIERGGQPACKCGAIDKALSHMKFFHEEVSIDGLSLDEITDLHVTLHDPVTGCGGKGVWRGRGDDAVLMPGHYHSTNDRWGVRTGLGRNR